VVSAPGALSPRAWKELRFIEDPCCERCGRPFPYDVGASMICSACVADEPAFERARAPLAYNDALARMLIQFKWGDRLDGVPSFARWMARAGAELIEDADFIASVPLHRLRLFSRRFNQSALLAQELGRQTGLPVHVDLLTRTRRTALQKGKNPRERRRNVRGAFAVRPACDAPLKGAHILLVDDVMTTGATVDACSKTLKKAGAARVDVVTVARVTSAERIQI
jgi:ComF family protein